MPYGNIALLNLHQYANLGQQTLVKISKYFEIYSFKSYSFVQACTNPATPAAIKWLNQLKKPYGHLSAQRQQRVAQG